MKIKAGKTSKILVVTLKDTASDSADGKTGLLHSDVSASYFREGQAPVSITLAAGSPGDAFSAGKFAEVSNTLARGHYYLHVPDAALAAGSESVTIHLQAAGVFDKKIEISLVAYDPQNSDSLGLATVNKLDTALEDDLSSGWQFTTLALENGPSGGGGGGDATAANQTAMQASLDAIAGYIDTEVAAIKVVTDKVDTALEADGGVFRFTTNALELAPTGGGGDATAANQATMQASLDTIAGYIDTEVAAILAAVDTEVAAIKTVADKLDTALEDDLSSGWQFTTLALENGPSGGGGGGDATAANQAAMQASLNTIAGYIDTEVAAIKTVTDKVDTALEDDSSSGWQFTTLALENGPSGSGGGGDATAANQAAMQASLDTIAGYIDTEVAAILAAVNALDVEGECTAAIESGGVITGQELGATQTAILNAIGALHNLDSAGVQAAAAAALAAYNAVATSHLPTNFGSLSIDGSGRVLSLLQGILSTVFSAETTGGRLAGNLQTFLDNADAATTKTLDDIGTASLSGDFTTQIQNALVAAGAALKSDLPDGFNTLVIVGGSARATIEGGLPIPLESDAPIESQAYGIRDADFSANFALATTAGTKLVFTLRENPRSDEADLEIDSDVGLEIGPHSTVTATDAVVERVDAGTVRVWIKASTFNGLTRKSYAFDLREINTTANPSTTEVKSSGCLTIQRTAGREIAA